MLAKRIHWKMITNNKSLMMLGTKLICQNQYLVWIQRAIV